MGTTDTDWQLAWSDEFDGPRGTPVNQRYWSHESGAGGWGNGELQRYTDRPENAGLDGSGNLAIVARHSAGEYTSARIVTQRKVEVSYGRVDSVSLRGQDRVAHAANMTSPSRGRRSRRWRGEGLDVFLKCVRVDHAARRLLGVPSAISAGSSRPILAPLLTPSPTEPLAHRRRLPPALRSGFGWCAAKHFSQFVWLGAVRFPRAGAARRFGSRRFAGEPLRSSHVVQDVMTTRTIVVEANESIGCARETLREADVRHLPVVDRGVLVGILSDRDIPVFDSDSALELESRYTFIRPASTIMSRDLVLATPESELKEVIDLMIKHRIGALPIVARGSRKLVGIVSYVDVLRAARDHL
jgi:CBS domain-containing protein